MQKLKVSICIMTYNQDAYLTRAIQSALSQTYENIEILIFNNGSTDDTSKVVESFLPNKKITFYNYPTNETASLRQNQAIDASTGDFISWLYGDDYYLDQKIEVQMQAFNTLDQSYGVVYGPGFTHHIATDEKVFTGSLNYSGYCLEMFLSKWFKEGNINPISPLVRRKCYDDYRPDNSLFTDAEAVYLRVAASYQFLYLDEPLVVMSEHESNLGKQIELNLSTHEQSVFNLIKENKFSKSTEQIVQAHLCEQKVIVSWHCIRTNRNIPWAKSLLKAAFASNSFSCMKDKYFHLSLVMLCLPKKIQRFVNNIRPTVEA
ncbi:glycosyltransferase family 2 protein [Gammaproteobacteria bacterium]|nr:glycosyltransferase family 2 protein [Gammaproteobacteria bacterium]